MRQRIIIGLGFIGFLAALGIAGASDARFDEEMRELQAPVIPTTTSTTTTVFTPDPIGADLSADQHDTEGIAVAVPKLPAGTTYTPLTTTTTLVPPSALCGEWWVTALVAGWREDQLPVLDRIIYNESRCISGLRSGTGDVGLAQLNIAVWSHLWEADGFTADDVQNNPALNLVYAKQVSDAAVEIGWCEFEPWHGFSGNYC